MFHSTPPRDWYLIYSDPLDMQIRYESHIRNSMIIKRICPPHANRLNLFLKADVGNIPQIYSPFQMHTRPGATDIIAFLFLCFSNT